MATGLLSEAWVTPFEKAAGPAPCTQLRKDGRVGRAKTRSR
jgi:hypothetical protein